MYERALVLLALLPISATVVGIVRRGRFRACRMFLLFLLGVYFTDLLPEFWPARYYTSRFWLFRESLHNALRFGVTLELAYFAFRSFPGARSTARGLLLLLLTTTLVALLWASWEFHALPEYSEIFGALQLPQLMGIIWLLLGISLLILWYRLPVDPMHKAILLGWIPYLLIFAMGLKLAGALGWEEFIPKVNYIHTFAYFMLLGFWAWAAWAPARVQARAPAPLAVPAGQTG